MTGSLERKSVNGAPELLADRAYHRLRRAIVTHELRPNEKISEKSLVVRFGLTIATVRSAIARLLEDGLVVMRSAKTTVVAPLTMAEVNSVFHLRRLLEPDAARQAAGRIDAEALAQLDAASGAELVPGDHQSEFAFLEANKAFHLAIAEACGNARQARWIGQLQDAAMRILWVSLHIGNRSEVWRHGHEEIIEALVSGNGDLAYERALHHLEAGQRLVYELLTSSEPFRVVEIALPRNDR